MKPVIQKDKTKKYRWIIYIIILIICIIAIGVVLYVQYYKDQNMEIVFGITDSEEEDAYNELKSEFPSLFTNNIEYLQQDDINVEKIHENYDLVVTAYSYQESTEKSTLDVSIPYINIKSLAIEKIHC